MNYKFLEKLTLTIGVSGSEDKVRELILNEIKDYIQSYEITPLGDLIVNKKGKVTPSKKLMMAAHMDEVGLIINEITEEGYLKFLTVGGIDSNILLGKKVYVNETIPGLIGGKPVHLMKGDEFEKAIPTENLTVDIGASSKEELKNKVMVGDIMNFTPFFEMDEKLIKAKALDDRIGCFLLTEMIKEELPYDITFAFTTREEVGIIGGKTASYTVNPDIAIAVEGTVAGDVLGTKGPKATSKMGSGPVISMVDRGTVYDRKFFKLAFETAEDLGIKAQPRTTSAGANDASAMHTARSGARAAAVSIPCRYIHSPVSMAAVEDIESAYALLLEFSKRMLEE